MDEPQDRSGPPQGKRGVLRRAADRLQPSATADTPDDDLKSLATRLAQGAAVVAALLTFFGIKDGQFDRLLRNEPRPALFFFGLAGIGIVLGLSVLAFKAVTRGRVLLVFGSLVTALVSFSVFTAIRRESDAVNIPVLAIVFLFLFAFALSAALLTLAWEKPSGRRRIQLLTLLLTTIVLVGGAFALTGKYDIGWRDVTVAALLVIAALSGLSLLGSVAWSLPGRALLLMAGATVFLVSLVGLAVLSVSSKSAKDRPRVEAELLRSENGWALEGRVSARGLTSQEHLLIAIEGVNFSTPLEARRSGWMRSPEDMEREVEGKPPDADFFQTIALLRVGPDADGIVDVPISAPVTIGVYDRVRVAARVETEANAEALHELSELRNALVSAEDRLAAGEQPSREIANTITKIGESLNELQSDHPQLLDDNRCSFEHHERSCLTITLPQAPSRPTLELAPTTTAGTVELHVSTSDLSPDDVVDVQLSTAGRVVYRARLSSGAAGAIDETVSVPVGMVNVCAVGRIVRGAALKALDGQEQSLASGCPPERPWELAWVELLLD